MAKETGLKNGEEEDANYKFELKIDVFNGNHTRLSSDQGSEN